MLLRILFLLLFVFSISCSDKRTSDVDSDTKRVSKYEIEFQEKYDDPEIFARIHSELKEGYAYGYKERELAKMKSRVNLSASGSGNNPTFGASAASTATFKERGPYNVPGRTRSIIWEQGYLASDPGTLVPDAVWYAASVGGGVWKSINRGGSWTNLSPDMENIAVSTIAMAGTDAWSGTLFAGTGESWSSNIDAIDGSGVFRTTDSGATWTNVTPVNNSGIMNSDFKTVSRIVVEPQESPFHFPYVVAAASRKIYRSTDLGDTWNSVYSASDVVQQIVSAPSDSNVLYAAIRGGGVIKSTDAGQTWQETNLKNTMASYCSNFGRSEIAVAHSTSDIVYSSTRGCGQSFFLATNDGGVGWNLIQNRNGTQDTWLNGQGWYDNCITVSPLDDAVVYVGATHTYKFTVDFSDLKKEIKWITDGYGEAPGSDRYINNNVHVDHHFLGTIKDSNTSFRIMHGGDGGVAISNSSSDPGVNNGDFTAFRNGYNTSQFYGADKVKGYHQYNGGLQDNGTWFSTRGVDASASTQYNFGIGGDGFETITHWDDPDKMMGSWQNNGHQRTINGGASWQNVNWSLTGSRQFVSRLSTSYQDPDNVYVVTGDGVWKTFNYGETWHVAPIPSGWCFGFLTDVEVSMANPRYVWAGSYMYGGGSCGLQLSTDYGASFTQVSNYSGSQITGIYSHPTEDSTVYVLFAQHGVGKIIETKDLGQTWEDITGFSGGVSSRGFPDVAVYSLAVMPYDKDVIWAGTDIGLVESTDRGNSWNLVQSNLPHVSIWDLKVKDQGEVVIATHGRGIWTATIPDLVGFTPKSCHGRAPELLSVSTDPNAKFNLRSNYDSLVITVNGVATTTILSGLSVGEKSSGFSVASSGKFDIQGIAYINGYPLHSNIKEITIVSAKSAQTSYSTNFTSIPAPDDFTSEGFVVKIENGFDDEHLINETVPYENNTTYTAELNVPIIVNNISPSIRFREVALVEPGQAGSVFGDPGFWDYVAVQARKKSSSNWSDLVGYDTRAHADWLSVFNSGTYGNSSMYKDREIDFSPTFNVGDTVMIKFVLYSDAEAVGWGWAIDDLNIQVEASVSDTDGDGVNDDIDTCPNTPTGETVDANGCSDSQKDTDGDGVSDDKDTCPNTPTGETVNANGCPIPLFVEDNSFVVKVYPNPARDELIVELNDVYEIDKLEFVDFLGKIHNITTFSKNNNKLFIDVSYYNSGVYTLNIRTDRGFNTARIIIER